MRPRPRSPTLTSSQWSLSSCSTRAVCSGVCGTTVDCWKGPAPVVRACRHLEADLSLAPPPLLPGSDGETEAQGAAGAWQGQRQGEVVGGALPHICGPRQGPPSHRPTAWQCCWPPCPPQAALTLIQGWFMNCVMVRRSVGSVFSRRRISCLARHERGAVKAQSSREPAPHRTPDTTSFQIPNPRCQPIRVRGHLGSSSGKRTQAGLSVVPAGNRNGGGR